MSDTAVHIEHVSKIYKLYDNHIDRLKESLHPLRKVYHRDFFALRDVSLTVKRGESIGIIGRNGSGKSTLLKILTGVLTPSAGQVRATGRISALLELGSGFNPELTGIENVYFNGTINGFSREQMQTKLDEILSFADIGDFVHQPVKTYSSGMFVRLAFAVAITIDPEILIVDEALAVGDIMFAQKCYRKIREFKESNKTIIMVTHDTGAIVNFCTKAVWLKDGEIFQQGSPDEVVKHFVSYMTYSLIPEPVSAAGARPSSRESEAGAELPENLNLIEWEDVSACSSFGEGGARVTGVALYLEHPFAKTTIVRGGEKAVFFVRIAAEREVLSPGVGFMVKDRHANTIFAANNYIYRKTLPPIQAGEEVLVGIEFVFPHLRAGKYIFTAAIADGTQINHIQRHWVHDVYLVELVNQDPCYNIGACLVLEPAVVRFQVRRGRQLAGGNAENTP